MKIRPVIICRIRQQEQAHAHQILGVPIATAKMVCTMFLTSSAGRVTVQVASSIGPGAIALMRLQFHAQLRGPAAASSPLTSDLGRAVEVDTARPRSAELVDDNAARLAITVHRANFTSTPSWLTLMNFL